MALTAQQRLTEAEAALHALNLGRSAVEITDANGEKVRYQPASVSRLRDYIRELKAEIAGVSVVQKPLRPNFGRL